MKTLLKYFIILAQVIALLLAPRFGWHIRHPDVSTLKLTSVYRNNGYTHSAYNSNGKSVDLAYQTRFSREIRVSIDGAEPILMRINIDGGSKGEAPSFSGTLGTTSDVVWNDSSGIFFRIYFFALILSIVCILMIDKAYQHRKGYRLFYSLLSALSLCVAFLVSLRVIL